MFDFSSISSKQLLGRILRLPLRLIPSNTRLPVLQGPLRGATWIIGATNHGCWLGSYEADKQHLLKKLVLPGMTCFDIGANVGFYTLLMSRLSGPKGNVVAFEPLKRNCEVLLQHVRLNACCNVKIDMSAISDSTGTMRFVLGETNAMGHLSDGGELLVPCYKLDDYIRMNPSYVPAIIKIDAEGAEANILKGAKTLLTEYHPTLLIATHGSQATSACLEILRELPYTVSSLDGRAIEITSELIAI